MFDQIFVKDLLTMALVIERKKLALEARKHTRASESLKMTSKSQSYDLIHGSDPWIRFMDQMHGSDPWIPRGPKSLQKDYKYYQGYSKHK